MNKTAPVTIVSSLYGTHHQQFVPAWEQSIRQLTTQPEAVIVGTDTRFDPQLAVVSECEWRHPQAYYLQQAITAAKSEWVWILDIDDTALPDALDGIATVQADVWQMGYERSDGETYIPPQLTAAEFLALQGANPFVGTSAIWTDAFQSCGGFPDVAFQDYGLWRRLAHIGACFQSSGRAHFRYNLHPGNRTALELVPDRREEHMAEMIVSEAANG